MAPRSQKPRRFPIPLTTGHNSKLDPRYVGDTGLVRSQGAEYRDGDPFLIHKLPGRSLYGTVGSVGAQVTGGALATFDDGTAFIMAVAGTGLFLGDATLVTSTFTESTLPIARSTDTTKITAAHVDDRWYVVTGKNQNLVVESDASVVTHGMIAPGRGRLTASGFALVPAVVRPSGNEGGLVTATFSGTGNVEWIGTENVAAAYDSDKQYATSRLVNPTEESTIEYEFTGTGTMTNKSLEIFYRVSNAQFADDGETQPDARIDRPTGWKANIEFAISTNAGSSYTTFSDENHTRSMDQVGSIYSAIDNAVAINQIRLKIKFKLLTIDSFRTVGLNLYTLEVNNGNGLTTHTNTQGALYYAITEYDSKRGWESNISDYVTIPKGDVYNSVHVRMPLAPNTAHATDYRIYRTSNINEDFSPLGLGLVKQLSITTGLNTFTDIFSQYIPIQKPPTNYEMLIQNEFGVNQAYEINDPPPAMTFIGNFGGALFGLNGRSYHQAIAGRPWQWPEIFVIDRMPFQENSPLRAAYQVGERLWIGTDAGVIILPDPIVMRNRQLILPTPQRLEGAPGCVGAYAATPLSFAGEGLMAWVTLHGVVISNLATYERITDDIDWENQLTEASLENSVLFWREKKQQLVLVYDKSGDGINDSFALIHMAKDLRNKNGNPLITWDHPGDFSSWWGGKVNGKWQEWTGQDSSSRGVFREDDNLYSDASNSHDGSGNIPFDVQTGRIYFQQDVAITRSRIFQTAPSTTFTMTVNYDTGEDNGVDRTAEILLGISGTRGRYNDFNIEQAGDFMQWRLRRTGTEKFAIGSIEPFVEGQEDPGDIA